MALLPDPVGPLMPFHLRYLFSLLSLTGLSDGVKALFLALHTGCMSVAWVQCNWCVHLRVEIQVSADSLYVHELASPGITPCEVVPESEVMFCSPRSCSAASQPLADLVMQPVEFYKAWDEWGALSNFSPHPIRMPEGPADAVYGQPHSNGLSNGKAPSHFWLWHSAEHYYQAQKFAGAVYLCVLECLCQAGMLI